jgi:hypothetical protein
MSVRKKEKNGLDSTRLDKVLSSDSTKFHPVTRQNQKLHTFRPDIRPFFLGWNICGEKVIESYE